MDIRALGEKNITIPNPFSPEPGSMVMDPKSTAGFSIRPGCPPSAQDGQNATICATSLRTVNTQAACGSADDYTLFSPWRSVPCTR
jgi:hypothetical protein